MYDHTKPRLATLADAVVAQFRLTRLGILACAIGVAGMVLSKTRQKRVFVGFAVEDKQYRDLLRGQSLNTDSPFEYTDMSVKEPWDSKWKTQCRERIKGCDGMIALLSKNTLKAEGARWEIKCAVEEDVPLLGIFIHDDDRSKPPEMSGKRAVRWTWPNIAGFIDGL